MPEHPRVRGENPRKTIVHTDVSGTSPRAQGKQAVGDAAEQQARNIPACEGKTPTPREYRLYLGEHPRVRGENQHNLRRRP